MKTVKSFYVLEYKEDPGLYYSDNQFGWHNDIFLAERYESPEEALRFKRDPAIFNVLQVDIHVTQVE